MNQEEMLAKLFVLALLASIFFSFFFLFTKKSSSKNYLWKSLNVVSAFLMFAFVYVSGGYLVVWLPLIVLVTIYNSRSLRFCPSCGKTNIRKSGYLPVKKCQSCGDRFD
ncbi:conserved hypothetical protein [Vibrio chagasii]|uniref:hypothetical protein n=1 Tax=Vibrio TaxID=662 RepID=UPI00076ACF61|nr:MULTISPECIES: hypothetical protein [Vibrio]NOI97966.1 hypothetical protein [Vibrio sp. T3Y01]PQJ56181.1 hypothetical protein BTO12_01125 [Vibrio splendidus]CAH6796559.1 conserved hypothetical protein [Vibrio chagasii]CAH6809597.1 conserved hypothetical protein [Vibrio chagasii]CAH6909521.1 conserved hypothetical protein [Vibrio chagasii]